MMKTKWLHTHEKQLVAFRRKKYLSDLKPQTLFKTQNIFWLNTELRLVQFSELALLQCFFKYGGTCLTTAAEKQARQTEVLIVFNKQMNPGSE